MIKFYRAIHQKEREGGRGKEGEEGKREERRERGRGEGEEISMSGLMKSQ